MPPDHPTEDERRRFVLGLWRCMSPAERDEVWADATPGARRAMRRKARDTALALLTAVNYWLCDEANRSATASHTGAEAAPEFEEVEQ